MKPLPSKKILVALLAAMLVLVLLLATLPITGQAVLTRVSAAFGLELHIEQMGGNIFNHLSFGRIEGKRSDKSQPVAEIAASDLRLDYSLVSLLDGVDAFLAGLQVKAGQAHLVLDLGDEQRSPAAESGGEVMLPAVLPAVEVDKIDLAIRAPDYEVIIADTSLQIDQAKGQSGQTIRVEAPVLQLLADGRKKLATSCKASLLYSADELRIEEMVVPGKLAALTGALFWEDPLRFELQAKVSGGQLQGSGSFAESRTELALQLENIDINELARLLQFTDFTVGGQLSGNLTSRFAPSDISTLAADIKLELVQGNLFGKKTQARLQATITDGLVKVSEFAADHGVNRAAMAGGTAPLALFTDWNVDRLASMEINTITLHLQDIPDFLGIFGVEVPIQPVSGHVLDARGRMAESVLSIDQADLTTEKNSATLRGARLQFPASGQSFLTSAASGKLQLSVSDLQEISSLLALPSMAGKVRGDADISGTLGHPAGAVSLEGEKLVYAGCTLGDVKVAGRADTKTLHIASLEMLNGSDFLQAKGSYQFAGSQLEDVSGQILVEDVGRYLGSCFDLEEEAAGRLQAEVSSTEEGRQRITLTVSKADYGGLQDATLKGVLTTDWQSYDITEAELAAAQATLRFAAQITSQPKEEQVRAAFNRLSITYGGAEFTLDRPASLALGYGAKGINLDMSEMLLASAVGDVSLQGMLAWQGESSFQVQTRGLTSKDWLDGLFGSDYQLSGGDLQLALHGPLTTPRAALSARIAAITTPQLTVPLSADLAVDYNSGTGLDIRKLLLATSHGQQITLAGLLPYDPMADNPFLATGLDIRGKVVLPDLHGIAADKTVDALQGSEFFGDFQLAGSWEQPTGELNLQGSNLYLHPFIEHAPKEPLSANGHIRILPGMLRLQQLTVQGAPLSLNMAGSWSEIPSLAGLIRQPPEGLPGTLTIDGKLDLPEVGWLASYSDGLRRLAGHVAATVSIRGPAARPEFSGAASLSKGSVRLANTTLPAIEQLELAAAFDHDVVKLEKLTGVFGGAPFQVGGSVAIAGADAPLVDCRLQGKNLLFYRDESMKIRADADLTVKGPWHKLKLAGKVVVVDGRYTKNIDFLTMFRGSARPKSDLGMQLFTLTEPPWRDMVFDVQISADTPFAVANNMARGAVRPNLRLSGTGEIPVLTGRIFVDPTRIIVPAGKIFIESGVVTFPENNPDRPTFNLNANSTLAGYDITLIFQGTSEEPVVTLSSDPPLTEEELLLLVLTGTPPQSAQDKTKGAMAHMNTAVYLGRGLLSKWFGGESVESEESVLDRFELDFGRQLSKTGDETVEAQFRVMEGVFLPGDRLFLTSEKDIYDNFNVGVKVVFRFK